MKQLIVTLSIVLLTASLTFAQDVFLEFNIDVNSTNLDFVNDEKKISNESTSQRILSNFSLGISTQIHKNIFLKSLLGTNDFYNLSIIELSLIHI